jgi:hypothetical protein
MPLQKDRLRSADRADTRTQKKAEYMTLKDIIKTDSDRLFHVDPECYILFTGDSVHDEQPFIRIGNWIDMPV